MSGTTHKNRAEDGWVCLGKFGAARGLKGETRLQLFSDEGEGLKDRGNLYRGKDKLPLQLDRVQVVGRGLVVKITGVDSRSDAEAITGEALYTRRKDLPETSDEEFYFEDLIGLRVQSPDGRRMGKVKEMHNFGAGDIVEIELSQPISGIGQSAMVPFRKEIVSVIDLEAGFITVTLEDWFANQLEATGDDKQ